MHQTSFDEMSSVLHRILSDDWDSPLQVLDVGSRMVQKDYPLWYKNILPIDWTYTGCDIHAGDNVDVVMPSPYKLPFPTGYFDVVISGQCLEHCERPWLLIKAMARVLKPGGLMIVTAPWTDPVHRHPIDCWRILPDGMQILMDEADLKEIHTYIVPKTSDCWGIGRKSWKKL